jgi:glycerophosphoryl diester phosphodiesterase
MTRNTIHNHKLPQCPNTGLARYRDRHQARQGAKATRRGAHDFEVHAFACPACNGYHLEQTYRRDPLVLASSEPTAEFTASLPFRKKRYVLVDIENLTHGAKASCQQAAALWSVLTQQAPGIAPQDHVVVGAARYVVRRYRAAIDGTNVKWVVGSDGPDGADRALLAAIDLRRVARDYDELVIASGDGAFTDLARRAKALGLTVHVITTQHPDQRSMLSRKLAAVADFHTLIRLESRAQKKDNLTAIAKVASRTHRRVHAEPVAA